MYTYRNHNEDFIYVIDLYVYLPRECTYVKMIYGLIGNIYVNITRYMSYITFMYICTHNSGAQTYFGASAFVSKKVQGQCLVWV